MSIQTRVHISGRTQAGLVRLLQTVIVAILGIGLYTGNPGIALNAAVGLLVTEVPAILERKYQITMGVGLVLWITLAMFLHAFGTVPYIRLWGTCSTRQGRETTVPGGNCPCSRHDFTPPETVAGSSTAVRADGATPPPFAMWVDILRASPSLCLFSRG
ncbi:MAG: hypothetical protein V5A45_07350 [Haloarculaceae archaeon]